MTFRITCIVVVMIVGPPAAPVTSSSLPALPADDASPLDAWIEHYRRRHRREHSLAGVHGVHFALNEAVHVRRPRLRGEVIHLVVHEETGAANPDPRAVAAVQRRRRRHRVARGIDHRVVRGLHLLAARVEHRRRRGVIPVDLRGQRLRVRLAVSWSSGTFANAGSPSFSLRSVKERRSASAIRCEYSVLPGGGSGAKFSRMLSVSLIVIPPEDDGGIVNSV
jgi:hypothetical protein